jgi:hypothetical protein
MKLEKEGRITERYPKQLEDYFDQGISHKRSENNFLIGNSLFRGSLERFENLG